MTIYILKITTNKSEHISAHRTTEGADAALLAYVKTANDSCDDPARYFEDNFMSEWFDILKLELEP